MIKKDRQPPSLLRILESLERRKTLTEEEMNLKNRLAKGWRGEKLFDEMLEVLPDHILILNDLLLTYGGTTFQIDTLVIDSETIHLYEIKYYEGNYLYENEDFHLASGKVILNPLHQLARTRTLLAQLLEDRGFPLPIQAHIIFPNPHFFLYQAPKIKEFIFLSQWEKHINKLMENLSPVADQTYKLADLLCSLHKTDYSSPEVPTFHYNQLKKELFCPYCSGIVQPEFRTFHCIKCGGRSSSEAFILHAVEEFHLLFPEKRVTTSQIHDWCQGKVSKDRILRVLSKRFEIVGTKRGTHYIKN
ncbi:nuclease-related domain-containing protein [Salimicrobium flavidum]|uniref:Nuclease-related domain-containing protein n=1 Tax=Salimicrobium flavidum TaxID=570947 RepID=A0A1N7IWB6_9BACI|nr:nuclease-related domain-containing protein [Salimicrobium flavidum]SIS41327.1 Nuclease-related domain-containing protein [Salimicrobium flavidum]